MAKRGRASRLNTAAYKIGQTLGEAMNRLENWRQQRAEIAAGVQKAVDAGTQILRELGYESGSGFTSVRKSVHIRNRAIILRPRKVRRLSAEARKRLSISAKKRWAAAKRAGKTTLG